jgi:UDP-GlcNAc:undecaprenyl-phosphate/decaprenyl-phosphate GlcNAc-1-phosphate transferase
MSLLVLFALSACATGLAWLGCRAMVAAGLADAPDHKRKAHRLPVPTSGGVAVLLGASISLLIAIWAARDYWSAEASPASAMRVAAAWACGLLALMIGFIDDIFDLRAKPKFGMLALLCLIFSASVTYVGELQVWPGATLKFGPVLGVLGSALWLFVMTNGVNFMDGANGVSMGSCAIGLFALALFSWWGGAPAPALAALLLSAALLGFLFWNFPNGKIFAGDAGSLFVGFTAGALALIAIRDADLPVLLAPLLFLPLLADVVLTVFWRARRKRNLLLAHRDHLYQVAIRAGSSHKRIAIMYWLAMLHCAFAASVSLAFPVEGATLGFVVSLLLFVYLAYHGRRFAATHGLDAP